MIYTTQYDSPIGSIVMAGDGECLTGLWFVGQKYFGSTLPVDSSQQAGCDRLSYRGRGQTFESYVPVTSKNSLVLSQLPIFKTTKQWLDIYFRGEIPDFTPPLRLKGTPFRKMVWEILLSISYGQTMTYGEIASKIAEQRGLARMSAQAVGSAVGHNPISIIVPCHRVVGSDGSLTGYAGGVERKAALLALEHRDY